MYKSLFPLLWAVPLLFSSADAWAWGLYTHVYFAQLILWTVPLLDPRFRAALRLSGIPEACHRWGRRLDRDLPRRFDYYVGETARRLEEINRVLEGERPAWGAEIPEDASGIASAEHLARLFDEQRPLPIELFATAREAAAAAAL